MENIYDRHDEEWERCVSDEDRKRVAATWMTEGTLDQWRHHRMLSPIMPLITSKSEWLTVGDGRYGTDAHFVMLNGGKAHATDISDRLLKIGSRAGFIGSFGVENAERLSFADNTFDFVLVKEAFHHFPRPWLALHEAFRVCRKAVIVIEPSDEENYLVNSPQSGLKMVASLVHRLVRMTAGLGPPARLSYGFEPVGNFVYRVSLRELEKFLLGMHYRNIATMGINDAYEDGVEFIDLSSLSRKDKEVVARIKRRIKIKDLLCKLGFSSFGIVGAALFKEEPTEDIRNCMREVGWCFKQLPKNPFR